MQKAVPNNIPERISGRMVNTEIRYELIELCCPICLLTLSGQYCSELQASLWSCSAGILLVHLVGALPCEHPIDLQSIVLQSTSKAAQRFALAAVGRTGDPLRQDSTSAQGSPKSSLIPHRPLDAVLGGVFSTSPCAII